MSQQARDGAIRDELMAVAKIALTTWPAIPKKRYTIGTE
jgi:hypothetical protein